MRRLLAIVLGFSFLAASAFVYGESAPKGEKGPAMRVTRMQAAGVVTEISAALLIIERKVMEQVERMEFVLEKPAAKIKAGDKVKVSYITRDGKNIATKVTADIPQKAIKKGNPGESKTVPGGLKPAGK